MSYENILVSREGRVGVITLNRPKALNALNDQTMREVVAAARELDADSGVGCIVLTGSEKAFAAGADIKEMAPKGATEMYNLDWFAGWDGLTAVRTPIIAAVNGYALGGGCEVAMMCDFIIAGDNAKFGQPEINLGVTPGMGGSQRLTRAVGKAKAMEMCLTGRMMDAAEAEQSGLVARVVPAASLMEETMKTAEVIAAKSLVAASLVKEQVNAAYEMTLTQGIMYERRTFHAIFASEDQKEGMAAFVEKRDAEFQGK
ncbi:enoyl-CoA hydratase [Corynebacterium hindlerae]|uniref:Probable enoyl-CoA hydratase echA8 n=1 Tax=Corynebacterium hindlerae TaxID=699041 RepID=A0A7G5FCW0_9CORY|nr:enoyl-CoA hydratase [Corynebacterium hindlerae]QMV84451.1 enoyl-CoA hydratase [Corynebacterium hindlerae]QTH59641.1 enoyl-CoA hydratase [Corynebacterium hindlerae]